MSRDIPIAVAAVVADVIGNRYTHAHIDSLMAAAGIERESPPEGNKHVKTKEWLRYANRTCPDPLSVLAKVIIELMEVKHPTPNWDEEVVEPERVRIRAALADYGLEYVKGGYINKTGTTGVSRTIAEIIEARAFRVYRLSLTGFVRMKSLTLHQL